MSNLSDYSFYILNQKKIGLFPRENFIFNSLKSNNIQIKSINSLIPFKFWSSKSFLAFKYFIKYIANALIGKNYLNYLIKKKLFKKDFNEQEYRQITYIVHNSLVDSTNKANSTLLTKGLNSFFISNIKWRLRYSFFAANLCSIVEKLGNKILNLTNTCVVIGDVFYCHETLITIFLLFKNKSYERGNNLFFYCGIFADRLFHIRNIDQLRNPNGPYGSKDSLKIYNNASAKDAKLISYKKRNFSFKHFVLYPPCISDANHYVVPDIYESPYEWANDLFAIYSNKNLFIKMHPMALNFTDNIYWSKLFKSLAKKYRVKINFLDINLKVDEVIDLGYYPLTPKGTVGLELLERGLPTLILNSNKWSSNFPELKINSKEKYREIITNSIKSQDINLYLKNFQPSSFQINLAKSIIEYDKNDFFNSIGIDNKNLPKVPAGKKNRLGNKNFKRDKVLEKNYIEKITSKESSKLFVKNLEKIISEDIK